MPLPVTTISPISFVSSLNDLNNLPVTPWDGMAIKDVAKTNITKLNTPTSSGVIFY